METERLKQEHSLLWNVLDVIRLPAFLVDGSLRVISQNRAVTHKLLFSDDELIGVRITEILKTSPPLTEYLPPISSFYEGVCIKKDREGFPCKVTVIPDNGEFILLVEDITNTLKLARKATQRRKELNTYRALSETLSRTTHIREMMEGVLETLVKTLEVDASWAYVIKEHTPQLCCVRVREGPDREDPRIFSAYEPFVKKVISSGKSLLIRDSLEDPRVSIGNHPSFPLYRSIAGVPLKVKSHKEGTERVIGVLGIGSIKTNRFTSLDIQFLNTVGNHLGVAIEKARLIEDLTEKMEEIELINEIAGIVNSSLSIGHIFRIVVSEIKKVVHFDRASITLLDENRRYLRIFALDTHLKTELVKDRVAPVEGTSAGWAALNQKAWINQDLEKEIRFHHDRLLLKEGIRSTLSLPLYKDRPIGTLNLDSTTAEAYTDRDVQMLMPIAKNLSIALENAMLFEEIYREKRQWEKTFDAITDMVWIQDLQGRILRVNRTVVERTGKPELTLIQRSSKELMQMLKISEGNGQDTSDLDNYREVMGDDGRVYHYWSYPLLDSDGRVFGVVNYLRDVTEQKRLQEKLIMADKLASLGTLVAGIAHEINNPLGIIAGYTEALLERLKTSREDPGALEVLPEYLETINREIFRCKEILQNLLNFARPSRGEYREVSIEELIRDVILLVEHRASRQGKSIVVEVQDNLPPLYCEPGAIKQMLLNLLMNSLYFTRSGDEIRLDVSLHTDHYGKRSLYLKVSDTGRGIRSEHLGRVFDPFFTTKPTGEGTGLGLSICHRIVTEHQGSIDVETAPHRGTTFHIKLPLKGRGK